MTYLKQIFPEFSLICLIICLLWVNFPMPAYGNTVTPEQLEQINRSWQGSAHALTDVNCSSCHQDSDSSQFIARPTEASCQSCHEYEVQTFHFGKHGIRLGKDYLR